MNPESSAAEIQVIPCQRSIGAEIRGVDLSRPLAAQVFQLVYAALVEYKVIFFRNQAMTAEQQVTFGQQFGELEHNPFRPEREGMPELQIIKNDKDHPVLSTDVWHADLTFCKHPTKLTNVSWLSVMLHRCLTRLQNLCGNLPR